MSENLIFSLLAGFFAFFVFTSFNFQIRKVRERLLLQAARYNGRVKGFFPPQLILPLENTTVSIHEKFKTKKEKHEATFTMGLPMEVARQNIYIEVFTRGQPAYLVGGRIPKGSPDTGNPQFDPLFGVQVYSLHYATIKEFLTSEVQQALLEIKDLKPRVMFWGPIFTLSVQGNLETEQDYARFIRAGLLLAARARHLRSEPGSMSASGPVLSEHHRPKSVKTLLMAIVVFTMLGMFLNFLSKDPQPQSVQKRSYSWLARDYRNWYPLPARIAWMKDGEYAYWSQWCKIMNDGIDNRMNAQEAFDKKRSDKYYRWVIRTYKERQILMLEKLAALAPPPRLQEFHDMVLSAGYHQIAFYEYYSQAKIADRKVMFKDNLSHPELVTTDKTLWAAYYNFRDLYPERNQAENDAIERRLAWFDMI